MSFTQLVGRTLRRSARIAAAAAVLAMVAGAGCSSHGGRPQSHPDGGAAGHGGAGGGTVIKPDGGGPDVPVSTCGAMGPTLATSSSCACDAECASGHCVEGVCCATACSDGCATCSAPGTVGTCVNRPAGTAPRTPSACPMALPASCGLDGTCDGAGACRKYVGTVCQNGSCSGDAVVGAFTCDGTGQCKPGFSLMLCVPYTCNPATSACYTACDSSTMCQSNNGSCDFATESCGKAPNGQSCTKDSGCISNHCVDKVCCNSACAGACTTCNQPGRLGTCLPIAMGKPDPRGLCTDQGALSCGHDGTCDGVGGCANYARDTTQCLIPTCTGNRLNTAGTCDGLGTCRAPGVRNCHPYRCVAGDCTSACQTNSDCDTGAVCQDGRCGPKPIGFKCGDATECASGFCVDGVCCESACTGTCTTCALPSSPGRCLMVAADNVDPRGACQDKGAAACGTNGKCDGTGSCAKYAVGTVCASETCASGVYTPQSTCNATGQCVAPDSRPCTPYVCNGAQCFTTCATNDQCKQPTSCVMNSCGLKPPGAACSSKDECASAFCAQGVCCNSACDGKCQSCALANSQGTCSNVPAGTADPTTTCLDQGTSSCGTNGKCDGNGSCQLYGPTTTCQGSSCPAGTTTFTGASSCDGAGHCVTPNPAPCFPYQCGAAVCKNSCTSDADCALPAMCQNGSCGLRPNGQPCAGAAECLSQFCAQGVCCGSACQGACQSCALPASLGTCSNVANGAPDPQGTCHDMGNASCGTDGFCNGSGACRLYGGGTSCAPPSCPAASATLTSGRTCDGAGNCQAATTIACAPYVCNGATACKAACATDADCLAPSICDQKVNLCGNKKRLGQACTATADCLTGNSCVDGVCCSASACPACQACNVTGSAGNCANVPATTPEPHGLCPANPPCGNTGTCDGAGKCALGGTAVTCAGATCTGSTFTPIAHCNGAGTCPVPGSSPCAGNFACGGNNACLTTCASDTDCVAPFTCQGSGTSKSCARKANGQSCSAANQCISGFCTDGVCCGTGTCGTCQACNLNGAGSCAFIGAGTAAPAGQCPVTTTCGNTGTCNGGGACTQASTSVTCGTATCVGATFTPAPTCSGTGMCATPVPRTCGNYICGTGVCKTSCGGTDADCAAGNYCTGAAGSCLPQKANGAVCGAGHECGSGNCVDGVCCSTASCGTCLACNVNGLGSCAAVGSGTTDPHGRCVANGTCGNTGTCNGGGACTQAATSVQCVAPSCTAGIATAATFCNGAGACPVAATTTCAPYLCGSTACQTTCSADTDCVSGDYCTGTGGSCQPKKPLGATCVAGKECTSANCVDGTCCSTTFCGTCQSCALNGLGTCASIGAGQPAPTGQCSITTTCGYTGTCNGAGACTQASSSTPCAGAICAPSSVFYTPPATCSGTGTCGSPAAQNCTPYLCTSTGCPTTCTSDADCIAADYCTGPGGSCVARAIAGVACTANNQCASNHCTDGFCCGSASCGSCLSCAVPGAQGTCTPIPAGGVDPTGTCTIAGQPAMTCGLDGLCDGAGGCQLWPATTQCSPVTCPATTSKPVADYCDGLGNCSNLAIPVADCAPFMCDGATSCLTACGTNTDCVSGMCDTATATCL